MSWLDKLKKGMQKTAGYFSFSQTDISWEDIEDALLMSDAGVQVTTALSDTVKKHHPKDMQTLKTLLKEEIIKRVQTVAQPLSIAKGKTNVILMLGVNGAGKTTTIGKMGSYYKQKGLQVSFVAADTFRAGAVEQLQQWGVRVSCPVYADDKKESAALVFDALTKAKESGDDIVFIDTAGRLQNRVDLMDELKKIIRVIKKVDAEAPHACLLVLDATLGQNALVQVEAFSQTAPITGLVMTKLDGTAKGGILLALAEKFHLPVHALGVGEQADDLQPFTAQEYADSLLGE